MIDINITRKYRRVTVTVTGHARAAAKGEDVVCAAVSTLVVTLREVLSREKAKDLEYKLTDGYAIITFKQDKYTKPYMHAIMCGFDFVASAYPQFIKLKVNGE